MKRILIADGDADSCGYIGRILIRRKICDSIDVVHDGAYVCEKLVSAAYGLVIIGLDLPDVSGLRVIRNIRENGLDVPTLSLASRPDPLLAAQVVLSGAQDLIFKPILLCSFVYSIKKIRDNRRLGRCDMLRRLNLSLVKARN